METQSLMGLSDDLTAYIINLRATQFNKYDCIPFWYMSDSSSGRSSNNVLKDLEEEVNKLLQAISPELSSESDAKGNPIIDLVVSPPGSVSGTSLDGSNTISYTEQQQAK